METQKRRVRKSERDVNTHVFANMAGYANTVLLGSGPEAEALQAALAEARPDKSNDPVSAEELTTFAKTQLYDKSGVCLSFFEKKKAECAYTLKGNALNAAKPLT